MHTDLPGAGKPVKPADYDKVSLMLELFDIKNKSWYEKEPYDFHIKRESFADGGFRNAFKAMSK